MGVLIGLFSCALEVGRVEVGKRVAGLCEGLGFSTQEALKVSRYEATEDRPQALSTGTDLPLPCLNLGCKGLGKGARYNRPRVKGQGHAMLQGCHPAGRHLGVAGKHAGVRALGGPPNF
jgi:hypothetical protein